MKGWSSHSGTAVCLATDDIDTDQIIPARFMSQPRADGYANFLLHDLRRDQHGNLLADFVLNKYPAATVLLCGKNFGSGSSREAAVYALIDSGIRVVIAQGFGDIFSANAINNGLLPAQVSEHQWQELRHALADQSMVCTADLQSASISLGEHCIDFHIDDTWRLKLINGWDDTDLTLQHLASIDQFRNNRYRQAPWAWPVAGK